VQDKLGGRDVLRRIPWTPRLTEVRTDGGYVSPALAHWCQQVLGCTLSVTQRDPTQKGFVVQQGRWVVERTFAWLGRYRRLSKDYEQSCQISEAFVYVASLHLLVRRLAR
jgi:putative transposase